MRTHHIIYIYIQTYYMQEELRRSQINSINANKLNTLRCWGWLADACVCCSPHSNIFSTRWYVVVVYFRNINAPRVRYNKSTFKAHYNCNSRRIRNEGPVFRICVYIYYTQHIYGILLYTYMCI